MSGSKSIYGFLNIHMNRLDSYDTSPLNSYHRMLVHKIAEFYRLTHIASPYAADCVRLFRGRAARMYRSFDMRNECMDFNNNSI